MKIYKKLILSLKTGNIIKEESFWYEGIVAKCKGGGSTSTTTVDKEYNERMASIAEAQQKIAEEYYKYWESDFKPYEQEQLAAARKLLPGQTELAGKQLKTAGQYYDEIGKGIDVKDEMGKAKADVWQSYSNAEGELRRSAGRMGINPTSGKFAESLSKMTMDKAKSLAGAGTLARRYAEEKQFERLRGAMLGQ